MAFTAISSTQSYTLPYTINSNLSAQKSSLSLHSRISFNSNFSKPNRFSLNKTRLGAPIMASLSDAVSVNTESYYDLLGISETDSIKEIKKAYKQLARKFHPDVSPAGKTEEFTKKFIQIQEAYEVLSDPRSRAAYDRDMASGMGLHANFSARSRRSEPGIGDMEEWEQRWQSQLADLIRKSNSKEFESSSWGDKMRRRKSYSN